MTIHKGIMQKDKDTICLYFCVAVDEFMYCTVPEPKMSYVITHFEKITHFENFFQSALNLGPTEAPECHVEK